MNERIDLRGRAAFTAALAALSVVLLIETGRLGHASRWVPLCVVLPTTGLLAAQLVSDLRRLRDIRDAKKKRGRSPAESGIGQEPEKISSGIPRLREIAVFSWVLVVPLAIFLLGVPMSAPLYFAAYFRWRLKSGWLTSVTVGLLVFGTIYGLLVRTFHYQLEGGLLLRWVG